MPNLIECLTNNIGAKVALKTGSESEKVGILAKRLYKDGSFILVSPQGENLIPRGDVELFGFHLPGDRKPAENNYHKPQITLDFEFWLFGSMALDESMLMQISKAIESVKRAGDSAISTSVLSYSNDIMKIMNQDFGHLKDQFQGMQTITTAVKYRYRSTLLNCC